MYILEYPCMHRKVPNKAVFKAFLFVKSGYKGIATGYSGIKQSHSNCTAEQYKSKINYYKYYKRKEYDNYCLICEQK